MVERGEDGMMDLQAFFKQEAAQYRLIDLMAKKRADDSAKRSSRTSRGNRTRAARRAGA